LTLQEIIDIIKLQMESEKMRHLIKKPIVLIGMMGSGKSTIGRRLAGKLNLQCYDSDKIIEDREGLSVMDIFEFRGESYFKAREEEVITEILNYGAVVLSTGGESFLNDAVRNKIMNQAISVWLKTDVDTLFNRVSRRNTRPQFQEGDKREFIEQMIERSYPYLENADIVVESKDMEAHFVVDTLMSKLKQYLEQHYR
jgi:shikimate kinase